MKKQTTAKAVAYSEERRLYFSLSPRQKAVFKLMAEGVPVKAIGEKLALDSKTVEYHARRLKVKLNRYNLADLTRMALRLKIVE